MIFISDDDDYEFDECNQCNQEFYKKDLNECPFCEIDDNKPLPSPRYCTDCCIDSLEHGYCEGECDYDFVQNWKTETFKKLFIGTEYKVKEDLIYTNQFCTMAFGHISIDVGAILKKRKRKDFQNVSKFYKGDIVLIINLEGKNIFYDIEMLHNAESLFLKARKSNLGWSWNYFTDGKLLLIEGENFWCLLPPIDNIFQFRDEEEKFNERISNGLDFFKIKVPSKLDWSIISPDEFEDLCYDLLKDIPRFENVIKMGGGTGELCRDISACEKYETLIGTERRKWIVQCKHYLRGNVTQDDLQNITNVCSAHNSDGIFIITSGKISSGVKTTLQAYNDDIRQPFKAKWWEKNDLINILEDHQEILKKYFFKKIEKN